MQHWEQQLVSERPESCPVHASVLNALDRRALVSLVVSVRVCLCPSVPLSIAYIYVSVPPPSAFPGHDHKVS